MKVTARGAVGSVAVLVALAMIAAMASTALAADLTAVRVDALMAVHTAYEAGVSLRGLLPAGSTHFLDWVVGAGEHWFDN